MAENLFCYDCGMSIALAEDLLAILKRSAKRGWMSTEDRNRLDVVNNDLGALTDGILANAPGRPEHPYSGLTGAALRFERAEDAADRAYDERRELQAAE